MNKIKKSIKYFIKIIFRIYFFKEFLYLITRIVDNDFYKINANGNNYFFSKSGKLNEYRIKTFVTKEPPGLRISIAKSAADSTRATVFK